MGERLIEDLEGKSRGKAQLELAHSEERFQLLVDSVKDYAIYMLDTEGRIVSWNSGAERIKGYPESEVLGQHFSMFYTPEDRNSSKPEEELRTAREQGKYEEEGWRMRKNGTRFWANVVLTPVFGSDGTLRGYAKVTRDVSQRRLLEETERKMRVLIGSVKDYAIFMLDPTGHIASWNPGAERFKGYTEQEIVGKHFSIFYTQEDLDSGKPARELEIAVATGKYEEEGWRLRKDGSRFWANVLITSMFDEDGRLLGFAKVTRDMTERMLMENELRDLNRQLEAFAYSVAHDLRAPLRSIIFTSKMLSQDYGAGLPPDALDLLYAQAENSMKLATIIDELLNLSRISRQEIRFVQVDLSELAEGIVKELRAKGWNTEPEVEIQGNLTVKADATLLRVVLLNLLQNAFKFSPNGGKVSVGKKPRESVYFVRDEGIGIEMEFAHKVFLPFERLVADSEFEGSGIGLANVQRALQRMGGRVWVESELGKGSTFYFTLS